LCIAELAGKVSRQWAREVKFLFESSSVLRKSREKQGGTHLKPLLCWIKASFETDPGLLSSQRQLWTWCLNCAEPRALGTGSAVSDTCTQVSGFSQTCSKP